MLSTKRENWHDFLEQVVFSINIRKRPATSFSAFELMNGLRKPRTPMEAENLGEICFEDTAYLCDKNDSTSIEVESNMEHYCESLRKAKEYSYNKGTN